MIYYYISFNYSKPKKYFEQALHEAELQSDDATKGTAFHYMGRIASSQGKLQDAMKYYIQGNVYEEKRTGAPIPFYHLRLAEVLISGHCFDDARDHLKIARHVFGEAQLSSVGEIQVELALAMLSEAQGNYWDAEKAIQKTFEDRKGQHTRAILVCLGRLFLLQLSHIQLSDALRSLGRIVMTVLTRPVSGGEGFTRKTSRFRNLKATLVFTIRMVVSFAIGLFGRKEKIQRCICPIHRN